MKLAARFNKVPRRNFLRNIAFLLYFFGINPLSAQIVYSFSTSTGVYSPIVGGTSVAELFAGTDDEFSGMKPIGFTFYYGSSCIGYTQFCVSANGWLSFKSTVASGEPTNDLSGTTNMRPGLAPLWDDLALNWAAVPVKYQTAGTTPNQTLTVQWQQVSWKILGKNPGQMSFQVKLYEGTNNIDFIYHQENGRDSFPSASIGIAGAANGDYYSVNSTFTAASKTTNTQNIATKPTEGFIISWVPDCLVMPIDLLSFTGRSAGKENILSWSTATETNNDVFVLERSNDGSFFTPIRNIKGAGNSLALKNYETADPEPLKGLSYYRLKQVDHDGKFTYSKIITVENDFKMQVSNVHQSPAAEEIVFDFSTPSKTKLHITLLNMQGDIVYEEMRDVNEGRNEIVCRPKSLAAGTYILRSSVIDAGFLSVHKIVKY